MYIVLTINVQPGTKSNVLYQQSRIAGQLASNRLREITYFKKSEEFKL